MMISVHTSQAGGLRQRVMYVLTMLYAAALIMGHALPPTHASARLAGQETIAVFQFVIKLVSTMGIVLIQIFARESYYY